MTRKDGRPSQARCCSDACRTEAKIRAGHTETIRAAVWQRDRGVCAACGFDTAAVTRTAALASDLTSEVLRFGTGRWRAGEFVLHVPTEMHRAAERIDSLLREISGKALRILRERYGSPPWEADHVIPVAEGGGGCGLDGYRTLCVACHRAETAALARRLAQARRREKIARAVARYGRPPEQLGLW